MVDLFDFRERPGQPEAAVLLGALPAHLAPPQQRRVVEPFDRLEYQVQARAAFLAECLRHVPGGGTPAQRAEAEQRWAAEVAAGRLYERPAEHWGELRAELRAAWTAARARALRLVQQVRGMLDAYRGATLPRITLHVPDDPNAEYTVEVALAGGAPEIRTLPPAPAKLLHELIETPRGQWCAASKDHKHRMLKSIPELPFTAILTNRARYGGGYALTDAQRGRCIVINPDATPGASR